MPAPVKEPKPYSRVPVWQWCGSAHPLRGAKWPQAGRGGDSGDGRRLGLLEASAFGNGISSPFKFCGLFCSATNFLTNTMNCMTKKAAGTQDCGRTRKQTCKCLQAREHAGTGGAAGWKQGAGCPCPWQDSVQPLQPCSNFPESRWQNCCGEHLEAPQKEIHTATWWH